jgi:hypothetical protein
MKLSMGDITIDDDLLYWGWWHGLDYRLHRF